MSSSLYKFILFNANSLGPNDFAKMTLYKHKSEV